VPSAAWPSLLALTALLLCCFYRNGQPLILTAQHRVYGFGDHVLEEIERVEAAGGWIVDGRVCNILAVSRAFGDPEFKVRSLVGYACCRS
jgi:hypothetical protein